MRKKKNQMNEKNYFINENSLGLGKILSQT